ncbi:hypothetical protein ACE60T_005466 [Salmonella enterica]
MKDDYHLPVVTRPERETRYPGLKKAKPSMMVQGLNEHQYNQISNGRVVPGMNLLTPYTYNLFSMGMDFFYVLSGVHGESLCPDFIHQWLNELPAGEHFRMTFFASRIRFGMRVSVRAKEAADGPLKNLPPVSDEFK